MNAPETTERCPKCQGLPSECLAIRADCPMQERRKTERRKREGGVPSLAAPPSVSEESGEEREDLLGALDAVARHLDNDDIQMAEYVRIAAARLRASGSPEPSEQPGLGPEPMTRVVWADHLDAAASAIRLAVVCYDTHGSVDEGSIAALRDSLRDLEDAIEDDWKLVPARPSVEAREALAQSGAEEIMQMLSDLMMAARRALATREGGKE